MKKKSMKLFLCAGMCAAAIAGTSMIGYAATDTDTETIQEAAGEKTRPEAPVDDGSVMAKISAVDDDTLTVLLAEQPEQSEKAGRPQLAEGETPPEKPEGAGTAPAEGETPPEKPENDGNAPTEVERPQLAEGETLPEKPEGDESADETVRGRGRGGHGNMTFAEEATTLELTSETVITRGMAQESASVSDLTEGTVVRVVLDGTTVVTVDIMENMEQPETESAE